MFTTIDKPDSVATESDPSHNTTASENQELLTRLIDGLPENQQQVIRLKFHSGLKYREISAATGLSEGNVGFLLHTALQSLRQQCLKQSPDFSS